MIVSKWWCCLCVLLISPCGCGQPSNVKAPPVVVTEEDWKQTTKKDYEDAIAGVDADKTLSAEKKARIKADIKSVHEQRMRDFEKNLKNE